MNVSLEQSNRLGPARVLDVRDGRVLVDGADFKAWATMALAYTYRPVTGDLLLVVGSDEAYYVIGVLSGRGDTVFQAPGDLSLSAPRGRIRLKAGNGVAIEGDEVQVTADRLALRARSVVETFGSVFRKVRDKLRVRAKSVRVDVDETYRLRADEINERAKGDVKIDGDQVRLG